MTNNDPMNKRLHMLFLLEELQLQGKFPEVGSLGQRVNALIESLHLLAQNDPLYALVYSGHGSVISML